MKAIEISNCYVNHKGELYHDNKHHGICQPIDGVKVLLLSDDALEYFIKSKHCGLLVDENCNIVNKRISFYTEGSNIY